MHRSFGDRPAGFQCVKGLPAYNPFKHRLTRMRLLAHKKEPHSLFEIQLVPKDRAVFAVPDLILPQSDYRVEAARAARG
jgi:hypothetical protein